MAFENQQY